MLQIPSIVRAIQFNFKGIVSQLVDRAGGLARFYLNINAFVLTTQVLYTTSYVFHMSH